MAKAWFKIWLIEKAYLTIDEQGRENVLWDVDPDLGAYTSPVLAQERIAELEGDSGDVRHRAVAVRCNVRLHN